MARMYGCLVFVPPLFVPFSVGFNREMSQKFVLCTYVPQSGKGPTDADNELCVMHARMEGQEGNVPTDLLQLWGYD